MPDKNNRGGFGGFYLFKILASESYRCISHDIRGTLLENLKLPKTDYNETIKKK